MSESEVKLPMGRRWLVAAVRLGVGGGAIAIAIAVTVVLVRTAPKTEPGDGQVQRLRAPVMTVRAIPLARQWRGYAVVEAVDQVAVPARVAAVVRAVPEGVRAGAVVAKGDLLAELDPEDFQRQLEVARQTLADLAARLELLAVQERRLAEREGLLRASLAIAREESARVTRLFEQTAATQQGVDLARRAAIEAERALSLTAEQLENVGPQRTSLLAQMAAQEATVELAALSLARTRITSPMDGVLVSVGVEVGERVTPGQPVAEVVGLSRVEVPLNLPASARGDVVVGDAVRLALPGETLRYWDAQVSRIQPTDSGDARTAAFFAELAQPGAEARFGLEAGGDLLVPGAFVTGLVTSGQAPRRLVVPRRAIRQGRVLRVVEGRVQSCAVEPVFSYQGRLPQLGVGDDQWVVLRSMEDSLVEGDRIVVDVGLPLEEGAEVEAVETVAGAVPGGGSR